MKAVNVQKVENKLLLSILLRHDFRWITMHLMCTRAL